LTLNVILYIFIPRGREEKKKRREKNRTALRLLTPKPYESLSFSTRKKKRGGGGERGEGRIRGWGRVVVHSLQLTEGKEKKKKRGGGRAGEGEAMRTIDKLILQSR